MARKKLNGDMKWEQSIGLDIFLKIDCAGTAILHMSCYECLLLSGPDPEGTNVGGGMGRQSLWAGAGPYKAPWSFWVLVILIGHI